MLNEGGVVSEDSDSNKALPKTTLPILKPVFCSVAPQHPGTGRCFDRAWMKSVNRFLHRGGKKRMCFWTLWGELSHKSPTRKRAQFKLGFKYSMRLSARPISTRAECRMAGDAQHVQYPSLPIGIPRCSARPSFDRGYSYRVSHRAAVLWYWTWPD